MQQTKSLLLEAWYQQPLGQRLCAYQHAALSRLLPMYCGYSGLILGTQFAHFPVLQERIHAWTVAAQIPQSNIRSPMPAVRTRLDALPFGRETMELVVLPHTLEFVTRPRQVLAEAIQVLAKSGVLVVIGFNPISTWGLARRFNPLRSSVLSELTWHTIGRVKRDVQALGCEIEAINTVFFGWPSEKDKPADAREGFMDKLGQLCWPNAGASYIILAKKMVTPLTPLVARIPKKPFMVGNNVAGPAHRVSHDQTR